MYFDITMNDQISSLNFHVCTTAPTSVADIDDSDIPEGLPPAFPFPPQIQRTGFQHFNLLAYVALGTLDAALRDTSKQNLSS